MIKINLLPKTIYEKLIIRNTAIFFAVLLVALIAGTVTYSFHLRAAVEKMEQDASEAERWEARVKGIQQQAQGLLDSIKPIEQKLDFIAAVLKYNGEFPKLYGQVARWTYDKVVYSSMVSDGMQLGMQARAKSLDDLGRYLLNMYRATDLFTEVTISGVPGYPMLGRPAGQPYGSGYQGGQMGGSQASLAGIQAIEESVQRAPESGWINFSVVCKLKTPIVPPAFAGGAGAAGAPGTMGMPPPGGGVMEGPSYAPGSQPDPMSPMPGPGRNPAEM